VSGLNHMFAKHAYLYRVPGVRIPLPPQNFVLMKRKILSLLSLVSLSLLMANCGGGDGGPVAKTYNYEKADSLSTDYLKELGSVKVNIDLAANLYATLQDQGYEFDKTLLTSPGQQYATSKKQALGLGMYSASLAYTAVYEQEQNTQEYLKSIIDLTNKLGIPEAFPEDLLKKLAGSDTTVNKSILLTKAYITASDQLYSEERATLVTMMVAGGFVEGLLISTGALKVKMNNQEISSGLYEQIYSYDNTIKMLEVFKDNKDVGEVLTTFKSVNDVIQEAIHTHGRLTLDNVHNLNAAMTNIKSKLL
jgi:hypothetical protein